MKQKEIYDDIKLKQPFGFLGLYKHISALGELRYSYAWQKEGCFILLKLSIT